MEVDMIEQVDDGFLNSRALLVSELKGVQMLVELKSMEKEQQKQKQTACWLVHVSAITDTW